ncbi:MAG: translation initiation factor IF-3 [Chloroflexi bacterium]|nr:MAG: translation initiation factor IF-3 [Chloroflexota bacterium]
MAPTATPPVCRLLDYGKYKYEQAKKERETRRSQKTSLLREVRLRPGIDTHDFEAKLKIIKKLLANGDKVKVTVMFRGRQITHPDIGWRLLQKVAELLKEVASVERQPLLEGKRMHIILSTAQKTKTEEGVQQS